MVASFIPESPIVEADWLLTHVAAPDVRVLDATSFLPGAPKTGRQAYDSAHIPGSRFFDIDDVADTDSALPHMLPSPEKFASRARKLGLGDGHRIICYDQNRGMASARAWWMFRVMGHQDVAVLNGGFDAWRAAGGEIEDLPPLYSMDRHFTVRLRSGLVRDASHMQEFLADTSTQIVDARPAARFTGEADEPRPGLRKGHIPGSFNLPHDQLLDEKGLFRSPEDIREIFAGAGVDLSAPIVNTCGSGVTACVLALAEAIAGYDSSPVYDGSWSEWGAEDSGLPVETGASAGSRG
ncbi:MAG: 3-mercaptopyruvate sulfurtransferase [Hyphomonadaceae bacterium]